jgi:hypothetical protein
MTVADVLDGMVDLFLADWRVYLLALGPVVVPLSIVTAWLQTDVFGGAGLLQQLTDPAVSEAFFAGGPTPGALAAAAAVSALSTLFVSPLLYGMACRIAADAYEGRSTTAGGALSHAVRRYPALLGATLLVVLGLGAVFAVPAALVVLGGVQSSPPFVAAGVIAGLIALPAVWALAVLVSLVYPCVVIEGAGPVAAVRRSVALVRGRFWRVLGILALGLLVSGIVAQIVSLPFQIPGDVWGAWIGVTFASVGTAVASLLLTPLASGLVVLLYFDGRIRKEGYDLELLVTQLEASQRPVG